MTIGGVDCGPRQPPYVDEPRRVGSTGKSMAGVATKFDAGYNDQMVTLVFWRLSAETKDLLKAALETTTKPGGTVAVVPNSGDDLGVGAVGSTDFIYRGGFRAEYAAHGTLTWMVTVPLEYIA